MRSALFPCLTHSPAASLRPTERVIERRLGAVARERIRLA
jgi:hypothetical protein